MKRTHLAFLASAAALPTATTHADTFGTGVNTFTIDFVTIGNPGNGNDVNNPYPNPGDGGTPYGGVSYTYRMGVYEISQDQITKATASGLTNVAAGGAPANKPAINVTWYEAAAFVNWLNTSTGHHAAYNLSIAPPDLYSNTWALTLWSGSEAWQVDGENRYRHKDAYYFLPNEDEWYKAAYHKNDGATANYWDYATGSNNVPDGVDFAGDITFDAFFNQGGITQPEFADVTNVGLASPYGTKGQNGNVTEWVEDAVVAPNDVPGEDRVLRGGWMQNGEEGLRSSIRGGIFPQYAFYIDGFRVAGLVQPIPEPSSALLLAASGCTLLLRRRPRP